MAKSPGNNDVCQFNVLLSDKTKLVCLSYTHSHSYRSGRGSSPWSQPPVLQAPKELLVTLTEKIIGVIIQRPNNVLFGFITVVT